MKMHGCDGPYGFTSRTSSFLVINMLAAALDYFVIDHCRVYIFISSHRSVKMALSFGCLCDVPMSVTLQCHVWDGASSTSLSELKACAEAPYLGHYH